MKVKYEKTVIDVQSQECLTRHCFWPRSNPGVFTQGRGYSGATKDLICGTRDIHGCPDEFCKLLKDDDE